MERTKRLPMNERQRLWRRRLTVAGAVAFLGLTAAIGKQAERAAVAPAPDAPDRTTTEARIAAIAATVPPTATPAQSATRKSVDPAAVASNSSPTAIPTATPVPSIVRQPSIVQPAAPRARTRTGSSHG